MQLRRRENPEKAHRSIANENKGKTVSFDDVKALNLTIHNKKVGRILTVLGCKRIKKHGEIYYIIPAELENMQLRDLTRTKRGHLAKQREKWKEDKNEKSGGKANVKPSRVESVLLSPFKFV